MNLQALYTQLSLDLNCSPEDFTRSEDILTLPALREGRRQYIPGAPYFEMVTLGGNAVITANDQLHPFLRELLQKTHGHWLFEIPSLIAIDTELHRFGFQLTPTHHMLLPDRPVTAQETIPVRWFYNEEIFPFYGDKRFPNAICPEFVPERPDRIVVCAYDGDTIMGMAGCSEDAPHWQQIGIDVLPEYRGRGIAGYLVTLLRCKIEERGDQPFYGTAIANYYSMRTALRAGFSPVWLEIGAKPVSE